MEKERRSRAKSISSSLRFSGPLGRSGVPETRLGRESGESAESAVPCAAPDPLSAYDGR